MKKIYQIAQCLSGNVLGIGVDEKISTILEQNQQVKICNLLNSQTKSNSQTQIKKKLKKINIKKIRKIFKKKKIDYIICEINEIEKYLKTFVKDSIYINKDMLYIYGIKNDETKQNIIKKYKRYNVKIEALKDEKNYILKIDNKNSKTNLIKDTLYLILDTTINFLNLISDILMN